MPRGANTVCPGGLRFGHHPSEHMAPHAARALHERTQLCSRHADRQGHSGRTPHVNDDRVGEACVCLADARARGQTTAHSHAQQLRVRSGQRTHRVWLCAITRKKTARARRGRNAHMHVAGRLPPCAPVWNDGTNARSARHPPQKQHTRWQPSSMRASRPRPARRLRRRARRPRRVAGASPLPVDTQMHSEQRRAKRSDCGNALPLRWPPLGRKCISAEMHFRSVGRRWGGNAFPLRWRKYSVSSPSAFASTLQSR
jgi:hypothetical protein